MAQQFIDYAIQFVFWSFAAHTVLYFTAGFMARRNRIAPGQLSLFDAAEQPEQAIASSEITDSLSDFSLPSPVTLEDWQWVEPAGESDAALVEWFSQVIAGYWQRRPVDNVVPFQRPQKRVEQAIDLAALGIRELRKLYSQRGLTGLKLSHATKGQLLAALAAA